MIGMFGQRFYGKVDQVPGLFYVATHFAYLNYVPLFPTATYLKQARNYFPFKTPEELTAWNNLFVPITQGS